MMKILIKKQGLLFCLLLIAGTLKAQEYYYDANGNLIQDNNKGLQSISYNHLNLVEKVTFKTGGAITYGYDAAGNKLSKTITDAQGKSTTWYYAGGFEYSNDKQLEFFATEEGRVSPQGEGYNYEYNLKDHLGNTRISFDKDPTTGKARIIQKDAYYPFGGIQPGNSFTSGQPNKYLYNGKELQEELGLFDYGARMYDPMLARWNGVDPLAEKYYSWSPYNYVLNNPLKYIDPDGREPWSPERLYAATLIGVIKKYEAAGIIQPGVAAGLQQLADQNRIRFDFTLPGAYYDDSNGGSITFGQQVTQIFEPSFDPYSRNAKELEAVGVAVHEYTHSITVGENPPDLLKLFQEKGIDAVVGVFLDHEEKAFQIQAEAYAEGVRKVWARGNIEEIEAVRQQLSRIISIKTPYGSEVEDFIDYLKKPLNAKQVRTDIRGDGIREGMGGEGAPVPKYLPSNYREFVRSIIEQLNQRAKQEKQGKTQ